MALRVGFDLASVASVRDALDAHGERYLQRVFTAGERADCRIGATVDPERLAARFAAKEATFKALRVGDRAVRWTDVEVAREDDGLPGLRLHGEAATLAAAAQITAFSLSLSHQGDCAAAIVIAEIRAAADI